MVRDRVLGFIQSWSEDDAYERFGVFGARQWLIEELSGNPLRKFIVACAGRRVIGLLDHIESGGAVHIGVVVDARFRRMRVGADLVCELIRSTTAGTPVAAECRRYNHAAIGLLQHCGFERVSVEHDEILWRYQ